MQISSTEIAEVKEIRPVRHGDGRGFFSEIFREDVLRRHGIEAARDVRVLPHGCLCKQPRRAGRARRDADLFG
jgi:dTDP-4-dehydrorhamnose 3,5-epimerase-like enzyme